MLWLCPVCNKYIHGNVSIHHFWWPRRKHRKLRKVTQNLHVDCHKQYHIFWYCHCQREPDCFRCLYERVCCYYKG